MKIVKYYLLVALSVLSFNLFAGLEQVFENRKGEEIKNTFIDVQEQYFGTAMGSVRASKFYLKLFHNDVEKIYYANGWDMEVRYTVDLTYYNGSVVTKTDTLFIDHHTNNPDQNIDLMLYEGVSRAQVTVTSTLFKDGLGNSIGLIPDDFYLEGKLETQRYLDLSTTNIPTTLPLGTVTNNTLDICWDYIEGAEGYEFEWVFVSDGEESSTLPPTVDIDYTFRNATRIDLQSTCYNLSLAYPKGYIMYRVRAYGYDISGGSSFEYWDYSPWSYDPDNATVGLAYVAHSTSPCFYYTSGLDPTLNWTYTASYAEEGKRKEVAAYFDGSGRNRQSVTIINSDDNAVVAESKYDLVGRAAVNILPAPTANQGIRFYGNANGNWNHQNFATDDHLDDDNAVLPEALPSGGVANTYYSSSNNMAFTNKKVVPDAGGYPYSFTQVSNDGLNRPIASTGVGEKLRYKAQGGRNTKYFYGVPNQFELDRLFGNEAGLSKYYQKNRVIDPNGQQSIQYLDMQGRTIATALAGLPPANLDTLPSNKSNDLVFTQIMEGPKNPGSASEIKERYDFMSISQDSVFLHYKLDSTHFTSCLQSPSLPINYDVNINIKDSRGDVIADTTFLDTSNLDEAPLIGFLADIDNYSIARTISVNQTSKAAFLAREDSLVELHRDDASKCGPKYIISADTLCDPLDCDSICLETYSFVENGVLYLLDKDSVVYAPVDTALPNGLYQERYNTSASTYSRTAANFPHVLALNECITDCLEFQDTTDSGIGAGGADVLQFLEEDQCAIRFDKMVDDMGYGNSVTENCARFKYVPDLHNGLVVDIFDIDLDSVQYLSGYSYRHLFSIVTENGHIYDVEIRDNAIWLDVNLGDTVLFSTLNTLSVPRTEGGAHVSNNLDHNFYLAEIDLNCNDTHSTNASRLDQANTLLGTSYDSWDDIYLNWQPSYAELLVPLHPEYCAYEYFCNYSENCSPSGTLTMKEISSYEGAMYLPSTFSEVKSYTHNGVNYNFMNPLGLSSSNSNGITSDNNNYFKAADGNALARDILFNCNYLDATKLSGYAYSQIKTALENYLEVKLTNGTVVGYYSIWYFLNDPDGIAGANGGNNAGLHSDVIDAFNSIHGDGGPCGEGLIASDEDKYFYFRSMYVAYRAKAIQDYFDDVYTGCDGSLYAFWDGDTDYDGVIDATGFQLTFPKNIVYELMGDPTNSSLLGYVQTTGNQLSAAADTTITDSCSCAEFQAYLSANGLTSASDATVATALNTDFCGTYSASDVAGFRQCINGTSYATLSLLPASIKCNYALIYNPTPLEDCGDNKARLAREEADRLWAIAKAAYLDSLSTAYDSIAWDALETKEEITLGYRFSEYHYTLYYYDQAGNLIKTVPPAGVDTLSRTEIAEVKVNRAANNGVLKLPDHTYVTNYKYNAQNQLVKQQTPDGGRTEFWYDGLGRLVLSQNLRQSPNGLFSYTLYDGLGRIVEVGELDNGGYSQSGLIEAMEEGSDAIKTWFNGKMRKDVVFTLYDQPLEDLSGTSSSQQEIQQAFKDLKQDNLRNRVASTFYVGAINVGKPYISGNNVEASIPSSYLNYVHAYHYDYDEHGNVAALVQEIPELNSFGRRFVSLEYDYDLISGNVKEVRFQEGKTEQFYHQYSYDADNRITQVRTSRNGMIWETDANYYYLPHGPLTRTEIGDMKIQGQDYAYTLQGWLKMVNGASLVKDGQFGTQEIGRDGQDDKPNSVFAADVMGFRLDYFDGDFNAIVNDYYDIDMSGSNAIANNTRDLYNGNIARMTTAFWDNTETHVDANVNTYRYDQLNRITGFKSFKDPSIDQFNTVGSPTSAGYAAAYSYDPNGNLMTLGRYGSDGSQFDTLTYHYDNDPSTNFNSAPLRNRLLLVNDGASSPALSTDLENQTAVLDVTNYSGANNYEYDATGNLVRDDAEEIAKIEWNVAGKIESISRVIGSDKKDLTFEYDAMGNRFSKKVWVANTQDAEYANFYMRDASGNVLAVYKLDYTGPSNELTLRELNVFGSDRLGVINETAALLPDGTSSSGTLSAHYTYTVSSPNTVSFSATAAGSHTISVTPVNGTLNLSATVSGFGSIFPTVTPTLIDEDWVFLLDPGATYTFSTSGTFTLGGAATFNISSVSSLNYSGTSIQMQANTHAVQRLIGNKQYELKNHLGNVLNTVSDKKTWIGSAVETTLVNESYEDSKAEHGWQEHGSASFSPGSSEPTGGIVNYSEPGSGISRSFSSTSGCSYTVCFDLVELSGEEGIVLTVLNDGEEVYYEDYEVNEAGQNYCVTINGTEVGSSFTLQLTSADEEGYFVIDNFTLTESCSVYQQVADVLQAQDYYPFGMIMPERSFQGSEDYRYGFNGMEQDDEVKGNANSYDFGARIYDSRVGRWLSTDPLEANYSSLSPYNFVANNPIFFIDPDGKRIVAAKRKYQRKMLKDIKNVFGKEVSKQFEFNDDNELVFTGDKGQLMDQLKKNKDKELVGKVLFHVMGEKEVTNIVYSNRYVVKDKNGKDIVVNPVAKGGEGTITTKDFDVDENTVVISPGRKAPWFIGEDYVPVYRTREAKRDASGNLKIEYGETKNKYDPNAEEKPMRYDKVPVIGGSTTRATNLFHGLGHVVYQAENQQGFIIDVDNAARGAAGKGEKKRKADYRHSNKSGSNPLK